MSRTTSSLFTGDTVLAGGTLSGILGSGNISDYIKSLQLLSRLRVEEMYPGHGRISTNAEEDLEKALENAIFLMEECKILFATLDTKVHLRPVFLGYPQNAHCPGGDPQGLSRRPLVFLLLSHRATILASCRDLADHEVFRIPFSEPAFLYR